jgi:hypothetical protein
MSNLLEFILGLLRSEEARAEFHSDPDGVLAGHGLDDLCAQDVHDALPLVIDQSRVSVDQSGGSFDRSYEQGGPGATSVLTATAPAPTPEPGQSELDAVVRQIEHITNNYVYTDSHDTLLDNSVNQNVWAGGDVTQTFDNDPTIASGDGAVAAGGDVDGPVTTGDDNVVGDENVIGDGNAVGDGNRVSNGDGATAFGEGDAYQVGDVSADDGSGVALGGSASGSQDTDESDHSVHDSGNSIDDSWNTDASDHSVDVADSGNTTDHSDHSLDVDVDDSGNTYDNDLIDVL